MKRPTLRPEHLWLLSASGLLLALLIAVIGYGVTKHRWANSTLADLEPRYARMLGLQSADRQMTAIQGQLKASLDRFVYPPGGDAAQIGNSALQRVRDLASAKGMRVTSSQVLPPKEEGEFLRLGLALAIEGEWTQFHQLQQELAAQSPAIFSENVHLNVQQSGVPGQAPLLIARANLFVLKARP